MATYITPADPIQWSESTAYDELVLVTDSTGKGYVSKTSVPQGTALTNAEYWVPIVNLSDAVAKASSAASTSMQGVLAAQYIAFMQQGSYPIQ